MVIIQEESSAQNLVTIYGASSDSKPTIYANGSVFVETDTLDVYMFDAKNTTWRKM